MRRNIKNIRRYATTCLKNTRPYWESEFLKHHSSIDPQSSEGSAAAPAQTRVGSVTSGWIFPDPETLLLDQIKRQSDRLRWSAWDIDRHMEMTQPGWTATPLTKMSEEQLKVVMNTLLDLEDGSEVGTFTYNEHN